MTITILPIDADETTDLPEYGAQNYRQAQAASHGAGSGRRLGLRSGFRSDTPSNVLTATSTTWTLGACAAKIDPGFATHQGGYDWATDANVTGSVTAADADNPRKDIVYIQVNDTLVDGSGLRTAPVLYLAGTPGVTPTAPTVPPRSFLVGTISVPVAGGGSPTAVLNPVRYVSAGGILPTADNTERDTLSQSKALAVFTDRLQISDGAAWARTGTLPYSDAALYSAYNATYGTPTYTKDIDGRVHLSGLLGTPLASITMTGLTSYTLGTLPTGYRPAKDCMFTPPTSNQMGGRGTLYVRAAGTVIFENSVTFTAIAKADFYIGLDGFNWMAA